MSAAQQQDGADPVRAAARLAAVQAVYEMDMVEAPSDRVLADFAADRWTGVEPENAGMAAPDPELLRELVAGVASRTPEIDGALAPALANRKLEDLEAVLRAILRAAAFELLARPEAPARSVISAYMAVADAFFDDGPQTKLINGVLNAAARSLRPGEFEPRAEAAGA